MNPSRIRAGLLTFLATALLSLGGTARAQLEILGKTTNLHSLSDAALNSLYSGILGDPVFQVKFSGSISTIPTVDDGGISPVFGLNGAAVPVVAYAIVKAVGPTVSLEQGTVVAGNTLLDNFVGYKGAQILAIYIRIGTEAGTRKEVGYLNYPGLLPSLPAPLVRSLDLGDSNTADLWLNGFTVPSSDKGFLAVESTGGGPSFLMQIGGASTTITPPSLDFSNSPNLYIQDGGAYAYGSITSVEVEDLSGNLRSFFANSRNLENALDELDDAQDELDDAKKRKTSQRKIRKAKNEVKKWRLKVNKLRGLLAGKDIPF
jgi:hypothetical protein